MTTTTTTTTGTDPASEPCLKIDDQGGVRLIYLNRPTKLNALNTELTGKLLEAMSNADSDDGIGAVVLASTGRAFCAGADLSEFHDLTPANAAAVKTRAELTMRTQMVARAMSKPVVAAVQGAAVGGGAGLALGADAVIITEDATLGYPEMRHSIVPALVMTGLREHFGTKLAFEMVSTGRMLRSHELMTLGLANKSVQREYLISTALGMAQEWADSNRQAMRATKELFYRVGDLSYQDAMLEGRRVNELMRGFKGDGS